jgi:hypothetical protein
MLNKGESEYTFFFMGLVPTLSIPSDELFPLTEVLVVTGLLWYRWYVHDKVQEGLLLVSQEVQKVAMTTVLSDHQYRS